MSCELCATNYDDQTNLLDLNSVEGKEFQLLEIIQKHISILEIEDNIQHSFLICRDCCQILCNFHKLYLRVEGAKQISQIKEIDLMDSDTPLAKLICDDLKKECVDVKLEPNFTEISNVESPPTTIRNRKRRSKRLFTQNATKSSNFSTLHEVPVQMEAEFVVKNEIVTTYQEVDTLNIASGYDFELHMTSDDDFEKINAIVHSNYSEIQKNKPRSRRLALRTIKSHKVPPSISSKYKMTKNYDEFLAKNFKFTCCLCHIPLDNFSAMKKHFRLHHNIRGYATCCGKKLLKRGVLVDHLQTHINPDFFKCSICNKVASDRRCLEVHMQTHEKNPERKFQCDTCSKRYFRRSVFLRHLELHTPEEEKKFKCPQCEKTFPTSYIMDQHLKNIHLNTYSKICDICGKSIRGREAFRLHQQEHAGVPKPLVECELCGLKLTNKYGLSRHMKTVHSKDNAIPQICPICSKISPTVTAHRRHMNYVHDLERKHACPMCAKAFKRAKGLKEHMTTHTGEVLYTCPHCPKTFNSNANMHSHRKKIHRKEWEEKRLQRHCITEKDISKNCLVQNIEYNSVTIN